MAELTICIPIAPYHAELAERAIRSAAAQTIPCEVLTMLDTERRGPGWCRNRMLDEVTTEFVTFLDADDEILPTFAEETIAQYRMIGGGKYIFTDWLDDNGHIVQAPLFQPDKSGESLPKPGAKPYCGGTWHAITTLIPTLWVKAIGGFDEQLAAVEDTDFYMKMCVTMHCGSHLARPLFHYSAAGSRGANVRGTLELDGIMNTLSLRYGGKVGCCGNDDKPMPPIGEKQPGDVLAMALWAGNQSKMGLISGRHYPRISMPKTCWLDPRDALKNPEWWRIIEQPKVDEPQTSTLAQIAAGANAMIVRSPYAPPQNEPPVPAVNAAPNVSRVVRLAQKAAGIDTNIRTPDFSAVAVKAANEQVASTSRSFTVATNVPRINNGVGTSDPIFVFSEKPYPSYIDIRRLVELSGFKSITLKQIDAFSKQPYIIVTPDPIGHIDFQGLAARVICWQLEYAGDYTNNYAGFGGEIWASDKVWADAKGAKYVLMGSHGGLAAPPRDIDYRMAEGYDVTMLSYMTPRRQAIKSQLADLRWSDDYPGHGNEARHAVLTNTRLMLHVHQHENAPFVAPQRFAIAAAYRMNVVSETMPGAGDLGYLYYGDYDKIVDGVREVLKPDSALNNGDLIYQHLCLAHPFRRCVEEALKV